MTTFKEREEGFEKMFAHDEIRRTPRQIPAASDIAMNS